MQSEHLRMALIGVLGTAAAFFMFGGLKGLGRSGPSDPLEAMPKGSFIVATVDFAELRRSPIYDAAFGKEPGADPMRQALAVGALAEACGFDPTTRVQRVAVSLPEEGERGEFGVAARVEVSRQELETCTRALAEKRGGHAETREIGSFVVLEDTSSGAGARPRLAYGRGGLLVVGKGTWFDAMLGAADHTQPGARDAEEHMALRRSLTAQEGFRAPTLLVTALLPRALRERLKREMGAETSSLDLSQATMAGVLGVGALGLAVKAGGPGQNVEASVELVCETEAACEAVDKLVQKKRADWSKNLALRVVGFGPLLDSFETRREGLRLRATASASADSLASTVERVIAMQRGGGGAAQPSRPPLPAPGKPADESIPSRPAPSGPGPGAASAR